MCVIQVSDDELLFRRVLADGNHVTVDSAQKVRISSNAFGDPGGMPSVDLASLCGAAGATWTQEGEENGVLSLETKLVRVVRVIGLTPAPPGSPPNSPKVPVEHVIDVHHDPVANRPPLRDNPAHAEIRPAPNWCNGSVFKKLKERLALLADIVIMPLPLRR